MLANEGCCREEANSAVELAEYNAQKKAFWDAAAVEFSTYAMALATNASANNKEAASLARDTAATAAMVFVVDMRRQEMGGTVQHQAMVEHGTALVLLPMDNKASSPTMPPLAAPMVVSSSPTHPTSYVGAVLSTMGGAHTQHLSLLHRRLAH